MIKYAHYCLLISELQAKKDKALSDIEFYEKRIANLSDYEDLYNFYNIKNMYKNSNEHNNKELKEIKNINSAKIQDLQSKADNLKKYVKELDKKISKYTIKRNKYLEKLKYDEQLDDNTDEINL